jgi:phenylacetate-CoA ligase
MNNFFAKYFMYYPVTLLKGEAVPFYTKFYHDFQFRVRQSQDEYRLAKLNAIIAYAKTHSEFHRERLATCHLPLEKISDISQIPLMSKQDLIRDLPKIKTYRSHWSSIKTTGGSTGEPVKLFKNPSALARERSATWRAYAWAGIDVGDKQARFWGVPHNPKAAFKAKVIDFISNRFRVSAFNLTHSALEQYYLEMQKFQPRYIYGYVSVINELTKFMIANNKSPIKSLKSIITTSEILSEHTKVQLESFWGVQVFNEYGCGEVGSIAHACAEGNLHTMADNLLIEIIDENGNPATTGEIVVTDFFNLSTPIIRYRIGDFATLSDRVCSCGVMLPIIENIHGRAYDLIYTKNGNCIHPEAIIYIFEDIQTKFGGFNQFQVIQESIGHLKIKIVQSPKWHESFLTMIEDGIKNSIDPDMICSFEFYDALEREKSGKMRVVKSLLQRA